jgi:hypothetical protein
MARTAAYLLLTLLLWSIGHRSVVLWYWLANRDYIAAELCEKRDTEEADCCKGKCFLRKTIQTEQAPAESGMPQSVKSLFEAETWFLLPETVASPLSALGVADADGQLGAAYADAHGRLYSGAVFKPPC